MIREITISEEQVLILSQIQQWLFIKIKQMMGKPENKNLKYIYVMIEGIQHNIHTNTFKQKNSKMSRY